ncbi:MAG: DUF5615 family PIN-like protein [Planctomycetota bacterium]
MSVPRFLLDQMLDEDVSSELRAKGYDVTRVCEVGLATADDAVIMARAIEEGRVLITLDELFGDG